MPEMTRRLTVTFLFVFSIGFAPANSSWAHEHEHTHAGLTRAIFEYLEPHWVNSGINPQRVPTVADITQAREGVIREDDCPRYYSHFYNPNTPTLAGSNVAPGDFVDRNCSWTDNPDNVGKPGAEIFFVQQLATDRAAELWNCALQVYRGSSCTEPTLRIVHPAGREEAFHLLGQVLHLLEDMTSPGHVHNDPHGKPGVQGFGDCKGQDADDFENWGWCISRVSSTPDPDHGHIRDYVDSNERMTQLLKDNLLKLYEQKPQGVAGSLDPVSLNGQNAGKAFVEHVAKLVYNFTTFKVSLKDDSAFTDDQPDSELRRMLRGSTDADCGAGVIDNGLCDVAGGWTISGNLQEVGFSDGLCGRSEGPLDTREEWWPMENGLMGPCTRDETRPCLLCPLDIFVNGFAYIENIGGEGPAGLLAPDNFIPVRYGCGPGDEATCGGHEKSKELFRRLYGSNANDGKTMLRIYGDVLYSIAVAYGAGLVQTFIEEVNKPTAVAGGPYGGEACQAIDFDASGSTDQNGGTIIAYDWDFTGDGVFDQTTGVPFTQHAYLQPFVGQLTVRVTDNDGFTDDDNAVVIVTPDKTPPDLAAMTVTPNVLWPPSHKMTNVTVDPKAEDACGVAISQIVSVTSNEPSNHLGDGNTSPDIETTGDVTLKLRAERSGLGNGRVYTITVQSTDVNGNSSMGSVDVTVPHSKR